MSMWALAMLGASAGAADVPVPAGACADGRPCSVVGVHPAGAVAGAAPLVVVEVAHGAAADAEPACPKTSWWRTGGGLPPVRILALCNDGYGASGVGEDSISVSDNRLSLSRYGGSAWRWTEGLTVQLVPLAVVSTASGSFHAASPDHESSHSADLLAGVWKSAWKHPSCSGHEYLRVPVAPSAPPPEVPLGSCAVRAVADGSEGFVAFGGPGKVRDGRLAAVLVEPSTLVIDVWDDIVVAEADSWVHADHIELWLGSTAPDRSMDWDCDPTGGPAVQWAIDWQGQVHAGTGASGAPPTATVTARSGRHRVVVTLPTDSLPPALTVVFSDADPRGATPRQERLVATSPVSLRAPHRLGAPVALQSTSCAVVETSEGPRYQTVPTLAAELAAGASADGR